MGDSITENDNGSESKSKAVADMKSKLRKYIKKIEESPEYVNPEQAKAIEIAKFNELYKPKLNTDQESYKKIPRFYFKLPKPEDTLAQKLREETRAQFLQKKSKELLDNTELKQLWSLLESCQGSPGHSTANSSNEDLLISYANFKKIREQAGPKFLPYLTAEVFGRLARAGGYGRQLRVRAMAVFNYAMRHVWLQQTRISLSLYDVTGQGYLREHDLESYMAELVPTLKALEGLEETFSSFYICTAVSKFMFFLDEVRAGWIKISDMLSCSFLDDLLELREMDVPLELQDANWFSAPSALRVYGQYLYLDTDRNGMLSLDELTGYGSGTLTRAFLERVFQQCLTYDGEMDYKTYLEFVLALENRREPPAQAYIFRALDLHGLGYLDAFTLNYFFKAIQEQMKVQGTEPVNFEDVKDEIFDMVRPALPDRITLRDLVTCGQGDTALSILIELHGFWAYENRDALASSDDNTKRKL